MAAATRTAFQWWKLKDGALADSISDTLNILERAQVQRMSQLVTSARLYGNLPLFGMTGFSFSRLGLTSAAFRERLTFNVVQSVVDTAVSRITKSKPRPYFLTSGGNYKEQRKAKKLTKFCDGIFYESEAYLLMEQAFRDSLVNGDGLIHIFEKNGRVCLERTGGQELRIDEVEAFYGFPRQMHRVREIDRLVVEERWPGKLKAIEKANRPDSNQAKILNVADTITVRESWHLRSGPDARDGVHCITINDTTLFSEKWEHDWFPFARIQWTPRMYGYWGQGLAEQLQGTQLEINKLLHEVQRSLHLAGTFKILVEMGSKVQDAHINNEIGTLIKYSGTKPEYITPPVVQREIYEQISTLIERAYQQAGFSALSATSQKPAGLDSGEALRTYDDIETSRFTQTGRAYERLACDIGKMSIAIAADIAEKSGKGYRVRVPSSRYVESIDWDDIDLDADAFVMQCFPVSALPKDPAGRIQTIQDYAQAGWLTPRQARRLSEFPDMEADTTLQNANEDWINKILDQIIDNGKYTPPEKYDDLDLAAEMALEQYQSGKCMELEPERLEMLRRFMKQIDALKLAAMPPAPPPGMPAQPGAAPLPPPQSPLLQNSPAPAMSA